LVINIRQQLRRRRAGPASISALKLAEGELADGDVAAVVAELEAIGWDVEKFNAFVDAAG
jgi:hypothetical protein